MSLYLNVPYKEKDQAKALGARWDQERKLWYAADNQKYMDFFQWIPREEEGVLVCNDIYIIEGIHTCFKCKKKIKVICFGIKSYYNLIIRASNKEAIPKYRSGTMRMAAYPRQLPEELKIYLKKQYNYYFGYSNFIKNYYFGNHCQNCGLLQGDFFLYEEDRSPFQLSKNSIEKAKNMVVTKIPLITDGVTSLEFLSYSTYGHLEEYAKNMELDEIKIHATEL